MKSKYYPPKHKEARFHCPHCNVFAQQIWQDVYVRVQGLLKLPVDSCICSHCTQRSYWFGDRLLFPDESSVEPVHPDLPEGCQREYNEARGVFSRSPRASAALLRLCLQKLLVHLGESGMNINDDIKSLVSKGLPSLVQKALDYCRVVGNNSVHPGQIDVNDSPDIAQKLFGMINFIAEDRITKPREIETLYGTLPEEARKAIEERDSKK